MAGTRHHPTEDRPTIAVLVRQREAFAAISAIRDEFDVREVRSSAELLTTVSDECVAAVIVEASPVGGESAVGLIASIKGQNENLPVIAYCMVNAGSSSLMVDVVRAGARALILRGIDDTRHVLKGVLRTAVRNTAGDRIFAAVSGLIPPGTSPLLRYALTTDGDEATVAKAAIATGVDRKTLRNRLAAAGIGPSEFVNWVRLGLVLGALNASGRTVERTAVEHGFPSGSSFRNMLERYTEHTPSKLRGDDGFERFLALFRDRLSTRAVGPELTTDAEYEKPA